MNRSIYDYIIDNFELYCPQFKDEVATWHPSGRREITVKLKNGDSIVFDDSIKTFRRLPRQSECLISEEEWKIGFGRKLRQILHAKGISQSTLADMSGISQVMISRYISGNSLPSAFAITRLAHALECSMTELTEF